MTSIGKLWILMKINLLTPEERDSLNTPILKDYSNQSLNLTLLKKQLDQYLQTVKELVEHWTTSDIPGVVKLPGKMKVYADHARFQRATDEFSCTVFRYTGAAYGIGDYSFARQLYVVSEVLRTLGAMVSTLAGYKVFGLTINHPSEVIYHVTRCMLFLIGGFGWDNESLSPLMAELLTRIAYLFQEVLSELTLRGTAINPQFYKGVLGLIAKLTQANVSIEELQNTLKAFHKKLLFDKKENYSNNIPENLQTLAKVVKDKSSTELINALIKTPAAKVPYSLLYTFIKETNKTAEVAGESTIPDALTILRWEISNPILVNYHINELRMVAAQYLPSVSSSVDAISNPLLWSYSTRGLLCRYRRDYSVTPRADEKPLSVHELQSVQDAILEGQKIQELLQQLRDPKLYEALFEQIELSLARFKGVI